MASKRVASRNTSSQQVVSQSVIHSAIASLPFPLTVKHAAAGKLVEGDFIVHDDSTTLQLSNLELNLVRDESIDRIVIGHLLASVSTPST